MAALLFGAFNRVDPEPPKGIPLWSAGSFASLAWLGLFALVMALLLARRHTEREADALAFVGLAGQCLLFSAGTTIALAVGSECQNYWDAYHFSALAWTLALSAAVSLFAVRRAAALGSELALSLKAPAIASVVLSLLGWMWTWSSTLQGLVSDLARALFLATHG
jgi:hypothetical protein